MAYNDVQRKPMEVKGGKGSRRASHDELIDRAGVSGKYGVRTDASAEGVGYLGMDDLDRIRRERLNKQTS